MAEVEQAELKTRFAEELLREPNEFKAALIVFPNDVATAMRVAGEWAHDTFVASEKLRLLDDLGPKAFLISKEDQAKDIYAIAQDEKLDVEVRLKAHRLYAEIMGNIEKPQTGVNVNVGVQSHVMVVKDHGTDDEWESKAIKQQARLVEDANREIQAQTN
jgi:hypothetical protein